MKVMSNDNYENDLLSVTQVTTHKDKNGDKYYQVVWPRQRWYIFKNRQHSELVDKWQKDEVVDRYGKKVNIRKIYKGVHSIPLYTIHRIWGDTSKKIGVVLIHYDKNNNPFLLIPSHRKGNQTLIGKTYFIFKKCLEDNLDIKENADVWFESKGVVFTP